MVVTTVEVCGFVDHRGRVHGSGTGRQRANLVEKFSQRVRDEERELLLHCDS